MESETAVERYLLICGDCQALLIVSVAEVSSEVDGSRRARGGRIGKVGTAIRPRQQPGTSAASTSTAGRNNQRDGYG